MSFSKEKVVFKRKKNRPRFSLIKLFFDRYEKDGLFASLCKTPERNVCGLNQRLYCLSSIAICKYQTNVLFE